MPETNTRRRSRFTIWHGVAASLLIHAAPAAPFVWYTLATPPDEPPPLVVELQGAIADSQAEQKVQREIKGAAEQNSRSRRNPRRRHSRKQPKNIRSTTRKPRSRRLRRSRRN